MNVDQFTGAATQTATQFVIAQEKIGLLLGTGGKTFKRIGSLFKVHIHLTSGHHQSGEWVSIYGKEDDRARAKEYIMSMCNPMVEEKIPYSADLHEHLVGKGGKTHRYLESNSSAVITFSTACTGPNEHTAHVRGSKESVTHATSLIKDIIRKTTKRRHKENQPPGSMKGEELDKELLHALKAENNLPMWETLKSQPDDAKRNYLISLQRRKVSSHHSTENSPSSSSEGGLEDGISSTADLLEYTKKLNLSEEDAKKVLDEAAKMGSGFSKNDFVANMLQLQRDTDVRRATETGAGLGASNPLSGIYRYGQQDFHSYPGLVSGCTQDFRLEQPGSSSSTFDNLPTGLCARSIIQQQQPAAPTLAPPHIDSPQRLGDFSSAPASTHNFTGSRYDPSNSLSLDQMLYGGGGGAAPLSHPGLHTSLRDDNEALLFKLLLEQEKEEQRQRSERQRSEKVHELLLRHSQQRYQQQQQLAAHQLKLQLQREHMSTKDLLSLCKQHQLLGAQGGPSSSSLSGSVMPGSSIGYPSAAVGSSSTLPGASLSQSNMGPFGNPSFGTSGISPSGFGSSGLGLGSSGIGSCGLGPSGLASSRLASGGLGSAGLGPSGLTSSGFGPSGLGNTGLGQSGIGATGLGSNGLGNTGLGSNGASSSSTPQIGSSILPSGPTNPSGGGGGPLSPSTPANYDLFSSSSLYRSGGSTTDNKLSLDLLESSEQVADLIKHLNL